jgi:hypothetical protein
VILGIPKRAVIIVAVLAGIGLIYVMGADQRAASGGDDSTAGCRVTVTADVLNVRAAPDPNAKVVDRYDRDAEIGAATEVQNGFRKLADDKWASTEFLKPVQGSHCD